MSNTTTTASASSRPESETASCTTPPSSAISEHSSVTGTPTAIRDWLMSCLRDSHASRSASQDDAMEATTTAICGQKPSTYFAEYDHDSRSWRTSQVCLLTSTPDEYTETWPKAGLMLSGVAYPQPKQEPRIGAIDGGVSPMFPTPYGLSASQGQGDGETA